MNDICDIDGLLKLIKDLSPFGFPMHMCHGCGSMAIEHETVSYARQNPIEHHRGKKKRTIKKRIEKREDDKKNLNYCFLFDDEFRF